MWFWQECLNRKEISARSFFMSVQDFAQRFVTINASQTCRDLGWRMAREQIARTCMYRCWVSNFIHNWLDIGSNPRLNLHEKYRITKKARTKANISEQLLFNSGRVSSFTIRLWDKLGCNLSVDGARIMMQCFLTYKNWHVLDLLTLQRNINTVYVSESASCKARSEIVATTSIPEFCFSDVLNYGNYRCKNYLGLANDNIDRVLVGVIKFHAEINGSKSNL